MESGMPLVFDHGESRSGLPELVERLGVRVTLERLPVGDMSLGRVLVERKEAHDFLSSLHSGRLFRQAFKLKGACARPLLLIEGDPWALVGGKRQVSVQGAVLSLLTGYGIPILWTKDVHHSAVSLARLAKQELRRIKKRGATREAGKGQATASPADRAFAKQTLGILEALPDVGPVRAQALLRHFGSIDRMVSADPAELAKVHGVGATTAARIVGALLRTHRVLSETACPRLEPGLTAPRGADNMSA